MKYTVLCVKKILLRKFLYLCKKYLKKNKYCFNVN